MAKQAKIENLQTPEDVASKRKQDIFNLLEEDSKLSDITVLPSQIFEEEKKQKEKKKTDCIEEVPAENVDDTDEWMSALADFVKPKVDKKRKSTDEYFEDREYYAKKKRKKKKKKEGEAINYEEEFERENSIMRNLLQEQTKFTNSLQQRYNILDQQKSSARGIGKFTTDLIGAINGARSLSKDLAKELINTKKTICELNMKERDRLSKKDESGDDMAYASKYLKSLLNVKRGEYGIGDDDIDDIDSGDEMLSDIRYNMENNENYVARSEESHKYLKYENSKVTIHVSCTPNGDDPEFYAVSEDGTILDDYPVPTCSKVNVNPSTMIATDEYGEKYIVEFK